MRIVLLVRREKSPLGRRGCCLLSPFVQQHVMGMAQYIPGLSLIRRLFSLLLDGFPVRDAPNSSTNVCIVMVPSLDLCLDILLIAL